MRAATPPLEVNHSVWYSQSDGGAHRAFCHRGEMCVKSASPYSHTPSELAAAPLVCSLNERHHEERSPTARGDSLPLGRSIGCDGSANFREVAWPAAALLVFCLRPEMR